MLALTPAPLQTAGERALFAELTRWDTGGAVRAAVVASLPLDRRPAAAAGSPTPSCSCPRAWPSSAIVEVVRQSGIVTATPEGAWTIGPEGGPGEVLQLAGGGSTPLDGLMRAGMDVGRAAAPRRPGARPDRPAHRPRRRRDRSRPADGDLGEGDQVSLLEPARCCSASPGPAGTPASTTPGSGRPPTSAPPSRRSASHGRGPVGRGAQRRGLPVLALRAAPPGAAHAGGDGGRPPRRAGRRRPRPHRRPPPLPPPPQSVRPSSPPCRDRPGRGRPPAAAAPAAGAGRGHGRPRPHRARDTVAIDGPAVAAGRRRHRGLFARGPNPIRRPHRRRRGRRSSPSRRPPAAAPAPPPSCRPAVLLTGPTSRSAGAPRTTSPAAGRAAGRADGAGRAARGRRPRGRGLAVPAQGVAAASTPARRPPRRCRSAAADRGRHACSRSTASTFTVAGRQGRRRPASATPTATVAGFFTTTDCTGLSRALYSAEVDGTRSCSPISHVRMPDAAGARTSCRRWPTATAPATSATCCAKASATPAARPGCPTRSTPAPCPGRR